MFSQDNKLYNVVLIWLNQRWTRKTSLQCCPTAHKRLCTKNNLQFCLNLFVPTVYKEITILHNFGPERTNILFQKNRLFQIFLVACFLTGYIITEQSWLFYLMLAQELIYGLQDNKEQGSALTETFILRFL